MSEQVSTIKPSDGRIDFTIEVSSDLCQNVAFPPTKDVLRGRWSKAKVLIGVSSRAELQKIPDIPGIHISLDSIRKVGRIYDILDMPENKSLLEAIRKPYAAVTGQEGGPEKEKIYKDMKDNDVKTWAHWMRRLVERGSAVVVSGILPSESQIAKLPGKTQLEMYRTTSGPKIYKEDTEEVLV